jgi:hypothetical protein
MNLEQWTPIGERTVRDLLRMAAKNFVMLKLARVNRLKSENYTDLYMYLIEIGCKSFLIYVGCVLTNKCNLGQVSPIDRLKHSPGMASNLYLLLRYTFSQVFLDDGIRLWPNMVPSSLHADRLLSIVSWCVPNFMLINWHATNVNY